MVFTSMFNVFGEDLDDGEDMENSAIGRESLLRSIGDRHMMLVSSFQSRCASITLSLDFEGLADSLWYGQGRNQGK